VPPRLLLRRDWIRSATEQPFALFTDGEAAVKHRYADEFLRCLLELDVDGVLKISAHVFPPASQPSSRAEALASLHLARTRSARVPAKAKRYSQRWLNERGLGSWLPDHSDRRER
jgi:hypothetical protein